MNEEIKKVQRQYRDMILGDFKTVEEQQEWIGKKLKEQYLQGAKDMREAVKIEKRLGGKSISYECGKCRYVAFEGDKYCSQCRGKIIEKVFNYAESKQDDGYNEAKDEIDSKAQQFIDSLEKGTNNE